MARLREACECLGEHFDTVQIFATRYETHDIGTVNVNFGTGNWFARLGQISTWLTKEAESSKEDIRRESRE